VGTFATLVSRLDSESGVRGKQFELICRWYLTVDPLYRRELKRVWLWDEWPGRWGADAGIDLVAEALDGGLWAVQAKAYNPRYRIKKSDVDTFLSESARPGLGCSPRRNHRPRRERGSRVVRAGISLQRAGGFLASLPPLVAAHGTSA
jgi:predicted helicase